MFSIKCYRTRKEFCKNSISCSIQHFTFLCVLPSMPMLSHSIFLLIAFHIHLYIHGISFESMPLNSISTMTNLSIVYNYVFSSHCQRVTPPSIRNVKSYSQINSDSEQSSIRPHHFFLQRTSRKNQIKKFASCVVAKSFFDQAS